MHYLILLLLLAATEEPVAKTYDVVRLPQPAIRIDGRLDEPAWAKAKCETGFHFPWETRTPPLTEFRALADDENLYFAFSAEDPDVVIDRQTAGKQAVAGGDRVELFFAPDLDLKEYFCVEVDALGRRLDYKAAFHRKFDFSWTFPGLTAAATRTPKGYAVEGSIPLSVFRDLGLPSLESGKLRVGIFRAEFSHGHDKKILEGWLSWIDPKIPAPDFHVAAAFGFMKTPR